MRQQFAMLAMVIGVITAVATLTTASADTQYFQDGVGWGKTYRNNYRSSGCYDHYGSTSSCYQGTWAETFYWNEYVSVYETPQEWIPTIPGNYGGPFFWYQKSAIQLAGTSDVVVSSDYDALFDHRVDANAKTTNANLERIWYVWTYHE